MASRKEEKERLRRERIEQEQRAEAAQARRRLVGYGAAAALALAAVVGLVAWVSSSGSSEGDGAPAQASVEFPEGTAPPRRVTDPAAATRAARCEAGKERIEGQDHVATPVSYRANPPSSGDHTPEAAEDAAYAQPTPTEPLVHGLEHGRILVWYEPSLPSEARGALKALYDEDPYHMILAPKADMPYEVAATAWGQALSCRSVTPPAFDALRGFKERYRDRGPEFVP